MKDTAFMAANRKPKGLVSRELKKITRGNIQASMVLFCQLSVERFGSKISTPETPPVKKELLPEIKVSGKPRNAVSQKTGRANSPTPKYQNMKSLLCDKISRIRTVQIPTTRKRPEMAKRLKNIRIHVTHGGTELAEQPRKTYTRAQHRKKKTSSNKKVASSKKQSTAAAAVAFFADSLCLCRTPDDVTCKENKKYRKTP